MSVGQRRLSELSREQSLGLLGSVALGRIVFTLHAMPAIRLVNHMLDGQDIMIRSHSGAAVVSAAGAAHGVVVAYEADAVDPVDHHGWSVGVTGTARLVTDPEQAALWQSVLTPWVSGEMDQVIRIQPGFVTGYRLDAEAGLGVHP